MLLPEAEFYVGIDWAAETHAGCVLNTAGKIKAEFTIAHIADGSADLLRWLGENPAEVPVVIERPDGLLADVLLQAGHPVVPVSPNEIKTWREGVVLSGAKSDPGNAMVIAEYLRLRVHRLRPAAPFSAENEALRTVVRTRGDIVEMRVAGTNRLAALLDAHWLGAKAISADIESPIGLEFLTHHATAAHAAGLGDTRLAAFYVKHGSCDRRPAAELLKRLHDSSARTTNEGLVDAIRDAMLALVGVLKTLGTAREAAKHGNANKINPPHAA